MAAVEKRGVAALAVQFLFQQSRQLRRDRSAHPENQRPLALVRGTGLPVQFKVLPASAGLDERLMDHAGGDGGVGQPVDEDEAPCGAIGPVRIEGDGPAGDEAADADFVQIQGRAVFLLQGVDVDLEPHIAHLGRNGGRAALEQITAPRLQGFLMQPDQLAFKAVGVVRAILGIGQNVAPADVDFVGQGQGDGLPGRGFGQVAIRRDDPRDPAFAPRRGDRQFVAGAHRSGDDGSAETPKIEMRPVDPLHRQAKGPATIGFGDGHRFEILHQVRPLVPGGVAARRENIVPFKGRDRDRLDPVEAESGGEVFVIAQNLGEPVFAVADQIHLVDRQHDVADADQ